MSGGSRPDLFVKIDQKKKTLGRTTQGLDPVTRLISGTRKRGKMGGKSTLRGVAGHPPPVVI